MKTQSYIYFALSSLLQFKKYLIKTYSNFTDELGKEFWNSKNNFYIDENINQLIVAELIQTDEKELLIQLREGNEIAFSKLYLSNANLVFRRIKRLVHIHSVAEELTQDVFYQIWKQRDRIDLETPFQTMAMRIAKSIAINFYKKAMREHYLREQLVIAGSAEYNPVEEEIDFNEVRLLLDTAIAKLPPQRRRVFNLCKIEGRRYEDVASEFGVSVGTIKDHMAKAIRFLKEEMAAHSDKSSLYAIILALLFK